MAATMRDKLHTYLINHPAGASSEQLLDLIFTGPRRAGAVGHGFLESLLGDDRRFQWSERDQLWRAAAGAIADCDVAVADFVVVDVETADTTARHDAILEIAAVRIRGGKRIDEMHSLVRPGVEIPPFVARLTGLDADRLAEAPTIHEVWPRLRAFVGGDVLLAHNAAFDSAFLQAAALAIDGQPLHNPVLCTLKLAKRLVPETAKPGLDSLAGLFGIPLVDRHRARGDARITAEVFFHLCERLEKLEIRRVDQLLALQNQARDGRPFECPLPRHKVQQLPDEPGIYRFFDQGGRLLYVGRAKNLRQRVGSYLSNSRDHSRKTLELIRLTHDLRVETTGSELEAALDEAAAIRRDKPPYNRLGKHLPRIAFVKLSAGDPFPRLLITRRISSRTAHYIGPLRSHQEAQRLLAVLTRLFRLRTCSGRLRPDADFSPCPQAGVDACTAPCAARVDAAEYGAQVRACLQLFGGGMDAPRQALQQRHDRAVLAEQFEAAASATRDLELVERLVRRHRDLGWIITQRNFLVLHPLADRRAVVAYGVVDGRLVLRRRLVDSSEVAHFAAILAESFQSLGRHPPEQVDGTTILAAWLRDRGERAGALLPLAPPNNAGWSGATIDSWGATVAALLA